MSGYAAIAKRMSLGSDLSAVRQFSELNYRNILYLQAELTHLEDEWAKLEQAMTNDPDPNKREKIPFDWAKRQEEKAVWQQFEKMRKKLKEYSLWRNRGHMG